MAVVEATNTYQQRNWRTEPDGARTFEDGYDVLLAEESGVHPITMLVLAQNDGTLPKRGRQHPTLTGYFCRAVSARADAGPYRYEFVATYSTSKRLDGAEDPTLEPPSIVFGGENVEEEIDTDKDLNAIATNVVMEPFDPPIVVPYAELTLNYAYNAPATFWTVATLLSYANKTNSNDWTGVCAAGEALIDGPPSCDYVYPTDEYPAYYRVSLKIKFRQNSTETGAPAKNAWQKRVLHQGTREVNDDGTIDISRDANGYPLNRPVLLDQFGKRTDVAWWKWFRIYDEADFTALGIVIP